MSEKSQTTPEATPDAGDKPDPVAKLKALPMTEKLLLGAAAIALVVFIIEGGLKLLFKSSWGPTCTFLGTLGVVILIGLDLFGVKVMDKKSRTYLLILCAVLPALGWVIDLLSTLKFWGAVGIACIFVMAYAGAKLTTRDLKQG